MKKRIMALICSFTLAAALTGCGSSGAGNETAKQPPAAEDSETETAAEEETAEGTSGEEIVIRLADVQAENDVETQF